MFFFLRFYHTTRYRIFHGFAGTDSVYLSYFISRQYIQLTGPVISLRHIDGYHFGTHVKFLHFFIRYKTDYPYIIGKYIGQYRLVEFFLIAGYRTKKITNR